IVAEWFLDNDSRPLAVFFTGHLGGAKLLHDGGEEPWSDGEVIKPAATAIMRLFDGLNLRLQTLVGFRTGKIAPDIIDALDEPIPHFQVDGIGGELRHFRG